MDTPTDVPAVGAPADVRFASPGVADAGLVRANSAYGEHTRDLAPERLRQLDADINAFSEVFDAPVSGAERTVVEGPLAGLTFAVKEVIDQEGRRTSWGVDFLRERIATRTAAAVRAMIEAGATCTGTTRSTLMAIVGDSGTRNPWDLRRTPGGSSAGSAAAVAAGFVDFALGTQTVGSIVRPAAYCGVVGFKPTFGHVPVDGMMPLSRHLDHVGFLAKDVATARRAYGPFAAARASTSPPCTALLLPELWFEEQIGPWWTPLVETIVVAARSIGLEVRPVQLPRSVTGNEDALLHTLLVAEIHHHHGDFIRRNAARLPGRLVKFAEEGARITPAQIEDTLGLRERLRGEMLACVPDGAALLLPSVVDLPPLIGSGTGARAPQRLSTLFGWPALNLPWGVAMVPDGGRLPLGAQLVSRPDSDPMILDVAEKLSDMRGNC